METNFFTNLLQDQNDLTVTIVISYTKANNSAVVSCLPNADKSITDKAVKKIHPLNVNGTLKSLDESFIDIVKKPIVETNDFYTNVKTYQEHKAFAEKQTQEKKDLKEKIKKSETKLKDLFESKDFNSEDDKDYQKALKLIKNIKSLDVSNTYANEVMTKLKNSKIQNELF